MRMKIMIGFKGYKIKALFIAALLMTTAFEAQAYKFSSSKVEILHGDYEERTDDVENIFTFANATGFSKGDTFFFIDVGNMCFDRFF